MKKFLIFCLTLTLLSGCVESNNKKTAGVKTGGFSWVLTDSEDPLLPGVDCLKVKGNIITAGSSTVYPLSERMAERFKDEGFSDNITIDSIGSGAGFERFTVTGESDISNASRPIKAKEIANAEKIGIKPIEFRVGTDALAVVVSKTNSFLKNLTMEELALAFGAAVTWNEINPAWPAEKIRRFIPGTDSGTFDYFVEEVYDKDKKLILEAVNTQLSEDDNVLVQGILGSPYAIGFFGYAYYVENREKLIVINIDGVVPSNETVDSAEYPLARPLYIYSDAKIMQNKPQVAAFINFFLTYVNEEIIDVGYFPANAEVLDATKQKWLDAVEGKY